MRNPESTAAIQSPSPIPCTRVMKPTTTPELSSPKSVVTKRQRKAAAPLGDVTNLLPPETPTPIKPRRAGLRTASDAASTASVTPAPKPPSFAAVLEEESSAVKSPISTVFVRRGTAEAQGRRRNPTTRSTAANKGKAPIAAPGTASCPALGRTTRTNTRKETMAKNTRPISSSAPCHEAKKKRSRPSTPKLPEDFVKKQRAYFADIDAFELPEEEVSESELE